LPWIRALALVTVAVTAVVLGMAADAGTQALQRASAAARSVGASQQPGGNVGTVSQSAITAVAAQISAEKTIATAIGDLSARQLAGQRVIYSYSGAMPPASLIWLVSHAQAAGVIFFAGNYRNAAQFTAAVRSLQTANASGSNPLRAYPLLLMTDQEGGLVNRLPGGPGLSERQIGVREPLAAAETAASQAGAAAAASLSAYGLNVDLAPVLDVYRQPGDFDDQYQRSYSEEPAVVSALGARFISALQAAHVAATAKHFPGLGAAAANQDTDLVPVTLGLSAGALARDDEYPYQAAIAAGVRLVMVSWAAYPQLGSARPAGLSPRIVQGILRDRLGFDGVTITDAIGAGALAAYGAVQNRALLAAAAGMDLILASSQSTGEGVGCVDGLESGYTGGHLARPAFQAAVARILALRQSLPA
jgi:beta-N-acetylhexosaminidase